MVWSKLKCVTPRGFYIVVSPEEDLWPNHHQVSEDAQRFVLSQAELLFTQTVCYDLRYQSDLVSENLVIKFDLHRSSSSDVDLLTSRRHRSTWTS